MKRDPAIDFLKGAAISLVVLGHALTNWDQGAKVLSFVGSFHVPVFFIAAGCFFNADSVATGEGLGGYLLKRIRRLWFPYVFWTCLFVVLHNAFISMNIYTDNPGLMTYVVGGTQEISSRQSIGQMLLRIPYCLALIGGTQLTSACWFLCSLFWISFGYAISEFLFRKVTRHSIVVQTAVAVLVLMLGQVEADGVVGKLYWFFRLKSTFFGYALFHLGVVMRHYLTGQMRMLASVAILFVSAAFLVWRVLCGGFVLPVLKLPICVCAAVAGWYLLITFSRVLRRLPVLTSVHAGVCFVGRHTMPILIFHFLAFKLVNYCGTVYYGHPAFVSAGFPVAYSGVCWTIIYTICGICGPLAISRIYDLARSYFSRKFNKEVWT